MLQYWEHGEETAAKVGHHKPPCEFARSRAERSEASFDVANMVGCTCGYFVNKGRHERRRRERTSQNSTTSKLFLVLSSPPFI